MPGHVITAASCSLQASQVVVSITARPVVVLITARPVVVLITARPVVVLITARPVVVLITARPVVVLITARPVVVLITARCDHHLVAVAPFWHFDGAIFTAGVRGWHTHCVVVDMKQKQAVYVCNRV